MPHRAGRNELKPAQRDALAALNEGTAEEVTRGQYQQLTGVSRSQAAYDLAELVEAGLVERLGGGRSTRYRLPRRSQRSQRHWTNERIRAALVDFCGSRTTWPSAGDFKAAGHSDLYVAASRYGGIGFWAGELGFSRAARAAPRRRPTPSFRPLLRWAAAATVFAAVVLGVAGAVFQQNRHAPAGRAVAAPDNRTAARDAVRTARPSVTRTKVTRAKPKPARPTGRSIRRVSPPIRPNTSQSGRDLAVQVVRTSTAPATSTAKQRPSTPSPTGGGPTPLRAPSSQSAPPAPLPDPRQQ
jgi:DNA-binding transcriptional ArsR family regulator